MPANSYTSQFQIYNYLGTKKISENFQRQLNPSKTFRVL